MRDINQKRISFRALYSFCSVIYDSVLQSGPFFFCLTLSKAKDTRFARRVYNARSSAPVTVTREMSFQRMFASHKRISLTIPYHCRIDLNTRNKSTALKFVNQVKNSRLQRCVQNWHRKRGNVGIRGNPKNVTRDDINLQSSARFHYSWSSSRTRTIKNSNTKTLPNGLAVTF